MTCLRRQLFAVFAACALGVGIAGCTESVEPQGGGDGDEITLVNEGQLTACTHLPYRPFQFTQDGEIVGFEVDLADLIAEDLGVTQEVIDTPWEGITSGEDFNTGKCDIAYGGATITEEREEVVDFSEPYIDVQQSLLVKADSDIDGLEDLEGRQLGVQQETTGKFYAEDHQEEHGYSMVDFDDFTLLATAVRTDQVAASIADDAILRYFVSNNPDTKIGASYDVDEQLGLMVPEGDTAMLDEVNKVLSEAKEDGTYAELYEQWFGEEPPQE